MYKIIAPLGARAGFGTFDTFFDEGVYKSAAAASAARDFVVVNFVKDEQGIKYFEAYHVERPDDKRYLRLSIQHFPFGLDAMDDNAARTLAKELFGKA